MDLQDLNPLIDDLASSVQQKIGFKSMPSITLQDDEDNADVLLGKTAYYDPQNKAVTVYVTNRHPKDILRSIAHELIHHGQNLRGEFDKIGAVGEGYAQNDEHLRNMEKQAYLDGNMCFRDWEDGYKKQMMESIHRQNSFKRRSNKMRKYKTNKNNELNKLLMEKFNLGTSTLLEGSCSANRRGKEDEVCPECGKKHATHEHDDEKKEEKVEEKKFPDLTGDGKVTQADILKGRGVKLDDEEDEDDKKIEEMDRSAEDEAFNDPKGAADRYKKNKKKEKKNESFRREVRKLMEEVLKLK